MGKWVELMGVVGCRVMEEMAQMEMRWRVCPAMIHPKKGVFAWIVILVIGVLIVQTAPIVGSVLMLFFIGSLATFLFPSTFTIDEDGLLARYPIRKKYFAWEQIRRVKFFNDACYLFTRKNPSNLDCWSGIAVYYGEGKNEIIASIKSHLREDIAT